MTHVSFIEMILRAAQALPPVDDEAERMLMRSLQDNAAPRRIRKLLAVRPTENHDPGDEDRTR